MNQHYPDLPTRNIEPNSFSIGTTKEYVYPEIIAKPPLNSNSNSRNNISSNRVPLTSENAGRRLDPVPVKNTSFNQYQGNFTTQQPNLPYNTAANYQYPQLPQQTHHNANQWPPRSGNNKYPPMWLIPTIFFRKSLIPHRSVPWFQFWQGTYSEIHFA